MIFSENPPPQEYVFGLHFMVNVMVTVTVNVTVTVTLEFPRKVARNSVDFPRNFQRNSLSTNYFSASENVIVKLFVVVNCLDFFKQIL